MSSASVSVFTRINIGTGSLLSSLGSILGFGVQIKNTLFFPCLFSGMDFDSMMFNRIVPGKVTDEGVNEGVNKMDKYHHLMQRGE